MGENIYKIHDQNTYLYLLYIKNSQKSTEKEMNNSVRKKTKGIKRHSIEEDILTANNPMKRCSTLLTIGKIGVKTTIK